MIRVIKSLVLCAALSSTASVFAQGPTPTEACHIDYDACLNDLPYLDQCIFYCDEVKQDCLAHVADPSLPWEPIAIPDMCGGPNGNGY